MAVETYKRRLETLSRYGKILGPKAALILYDDLVDNPEPVLSALTAFLGVNPGITSRYSTQVITGRFGDPSENIFAGKVIKTSSYSVEINAQLLDMAQVAFRECREQLRELYVLVGSPHRGRNA